MCRLLPHSTRPSPTDRRVGVLKLFRGSNRQRAEAVCERALAFGAHTYKSVASILKNGLDKRPSAASQPTPVIRHNNIRGPGYYQ